MSTFGPNQFELLRSVTTEYTALKAADVATHIGVDELAAAYEEVGTETTALAALNATEYALYTQQQADGTAKNTPSPGSNVLYAAASFDARTDEAMLKPVGPYTEVAVLAGIVALLMPVNNEGMVGMTILTANAALDTAEPYLRKERRIISPAPSTEALDVDDDDVAAVLTMLERVVRASAKLRGETPA